MKPIQYNSDDLKGPISEKQKDFILSLLSKRNYDPASLHNIERILQLHPSKDLIYPDEWVDSMSKSEASKVIRYLLK
jgi:hypothetical protein